MPTIAENGVPGFDLDIWFGVAAPAKTPPDVVARLSKEIAEIVAQPDVQGADREDRLERRLSRRRRSSAQQVRDDHERFGKIIRDAGIEPN